MPDDATIIALRSDTASTPTAKREAPQVQPDRPGAMPSALEKLARSPRRPWRRRTLFALLPLAVIVGCYWYITGGAVMSTDDAYVEADKVGISTDISGIVADVDVTDNQHVVAGQILYRLDPRQFQIALGNAKANLAETALSIEAMKEDYKRMLSDAAAQQAQVDLDQVNHDRYATLLRSATVSKATFDQAHYTLDTDKNKLDSLHRQAAAQLARLAGDPTIPVTLHPQYLQAQAKVDEAQRQFDHTTVVAPFSGIVTNVPTIAPGKYLPASTIAFYLVDTDHIWLAANPKETELTYVRPGQRVTVRVDTYPNVEWHGTVESISPAAA